MNWPRTAPAYLRYGIALLAVLTSTAVGLALRPHTYTTPYLYFYPAILFALWLGGFGPGMVATVATALVVDFEFIAPLHNVLSQTTDVLRAIYFVLSFGFICWLVDKRRVQAEDRIKSQADMLEAANDAILVLDDDGRINYWNRGAERLYGWKQEEVLGQPATELLSTRFPIAPEEVRSQTRDLGEWRGELVHTTRDGKIVLVASSWNPLRDAQGNVIGTYEINRDITAQRETEKALQVSEKLATVGRLTSTIAHELNNPLESLQGICYLLEQNQALDESDRNLVEMAKNELAQMAQIARYALGLTREAGKPVAVDVAQLTEDVSHLYSRRREFASLSISRAYDTRSTVLGYPSEIRQLMSNLILNACEAGGENGNVTIHVFESRDWRSTHRNGIRVVVGNAGSVVRPEHRTRIFEPFFTTKGERGNGLGLWVSQTVVAKHNGSIAVRSFRSKKDNEHWTFFSVFLPFEGPAHLTGNNIGEIVA